METTVLATKPNILIIGPGPDEVGGVTTFIQFILCSSHLKQHFNIRHMETSRGQKNQASAGRLSTLNLSLLFVQAFQLFSIMMKQKPQVVHLNVTAGWSFWKTALFTLISRFFKAKTIAHIHGGNFNIFADSKRSIRRKIVGIVLGWADTIVVLSGWWRDYIQALVQKPIQILVISNAPDESLFIASENPVPRESYNRRTVIFVGSIGRRKGIFDILDTIPLVLQKWKGVRFLFLGEEEIAGEKEQVLKICRQNSLDQHVDFLGWVTGNEKITYLQEADIFILPSHSENLPYALLEAMAVGLPIITTPVGGIPEVVEDGKDGFLIEPGNVEQLASRIIELLEKPQLRERLGRNAREKIRREFSAEEVSQKWETLYSRLCRNPS